ATFLGFPHANLSLLSYFYSKFKLYNLYRWIYRHTAGGRNTDGSSPLRFIPRICVEDMGSGVVLATVIRPSGERAAAFCCMACSSPASRAAAAIFTCPNSSRHLCH